MTNREPFGRFLLRLLVIAAATLSVIIVLLVPARYAAVETAYGGGKRWTRSAAEAHCRDRWTTRLLLKWVPDNEFLPDAED